VQNPVQFLVVLAKALCVDFVKGYLSSESSPIRMLRAFLGLDQAGTRVGFAISFTRFL
jgi:hypothetical protein